MLGCVGVGRNRSGSGRRNSCSNSEFLSATSAKFLPRLIREPRRPLRKYRTRHRSDDLHDSRPDTGDNSCPTVFDKLLRCQRRFQALKASRWGSSVLGHRLERLDSPSTRCIASVYEPRGQILDCFLGSLDPRTIPCTHWRTPQRPRGQRREKWYRDYLWFVVGSRWPFFW